MKDYRQYSRPYTSDEWEEDKDWIARRLDFLWTLRDYYTELYLNGNFCHEKEAIYKYYGSDNEIASLAKHYHHDQYNNSPKIDSSKTYELIKEYLDLQRVRECCKDIFLRKRKYIRYYFLEEYISNYLDEELSWYKQEYGYE